MNKPLIYQGKSLLSHRQLSIDMTTKQCTKSCVQCFSLLGDATRLKIFTKIRSGIDQVKLLEKEIAVSQPTISHHLKLLTDYGLISATKTGRETKYAYKSTFACTGCNLFNSQFAVRN